MPLLVVENLSTSFFTDDGDVHAVQNVSFTLEPGETLGIVGESGSGKTVTSKSILRIIPSPPGKITGGRVLLHDEDLVQATEKRMQQIRGNAIAMIFQEPMSALNPVFTIGWQIDEALKLHQRELSKADRRARVHELLELVRIPSPEQRIDEFPHQLSGGMRQRAMIAMALACSPEVLIADEPTTALDVTIQAQVLRLLQQLREELGTAVILITHDLGVVAEVCDRVVVMYAAQVVEQGTITDIFHRPAHPYTTALLQSIPKSGKRVPGRKFPSIPGIVPDLRNLPPGCRFRTRCYKVQPECAKADVDLVTFGDRREVRCLFPNESETA